MSKNPPKQAAKPCKQGTKAHNCKQDKDGNHINLDQLTAHK